MVRIFSVHETFNDSIDARYQCAFDTLVELFPFVQTIGEQNLVSVQLTTVDSTVSISYSHKEAVQ